MLQGLCGSVVRCCVRSVFGASRPTTPTSAREQRVERVVRPPVMSCRTVTEAKADARRLLVPAPTTGVAKMDRHDSLADLQQPMSPRATVDHVAREVFLLVRLTLNLWTYLGLGEWLAFLSWRLRSQQIGSNLLCP